MEAPRVVRMHFDGQLLKRGVWIYVWEIRSQGQRVLYVGRTVTVHHRMHHRRSRASVRT
jgi:hypothetical protein